MADINHSKGIKKFQDSAEAIMARLQKQVEEARNADAENKSLDDYDRHMADMRRLQMLGEAKKWWKFVEQNAREGETLEEVDKRIRKEIEAKETLERAGLSYPVSLPSWPESKRALPNGMLRSALFGAIGKGRRRYLDREPINAIEGIQIIYTGIRLDQSDLDVYESVLHALRSKEMGLLYKITTYGLLKTMGKKDTGGKGSRKTLEDSLARLRANAIVLKQGQYTYMGGLLDWAIKDEKTKQWFISLNPTLRLLYEPDQFTWIDWEIRKILNRQPLAQWLHGYYASHAEPLPIKIETLRQLCGSETELLKHFKEKLRKALDAVVEAFKAVGQDFKYVIHNGYVYVKKQPSKSQQRYLERRKRNR